MKVYLVTTGSYSDYSVSAVFSDKALAEAHQSELSEANEVETYELVDTPPTRFTVYGISNDSHRGAGVDHEWSYLVWNYNRGNYQRAEVTEYDSGLHHGIRVMGRDREAVRQAYREAKARRAAREAGL